ncbi:MAG TPA: hypothetical protein VFI73_06425 [Candidatus Nitrosopolaris sp.]|nr:hypothetical protein [Candidatus Nitrosopolaris sp.]
MNSDPDSKKTLILAQHDFDAFFNPKESCKNRNDLQDAIKPRANMTSQVDGTSTSTEERFWKRILIIVDHD